MTGVSAGALPGTDGVGTASMAVCEPAGLSATTGGVAAGIDSREGARVAAAARVDG
jgi:hypothetical protein